MVTLDEEIPCSAAFSSSTAIRYSGLRIFDVPIHVDNVRRLLKDLLDLFRDVNLAGSIGTIDFGHERLHDGRAGRNLAYLDPCTVRQPDLLKFGSEALRDLMALRASICQRKQIDLYVRLIRLIAQIVMPDKSVKVIRTGESGVELIVRYFRLLAEILAERLANTCCLLQRGSVGHVDDNLELALVVERQHFYLHQLERN